MSENSPSPSRFDQVIGDTLIHEGGYVNDPDDPGGETRYGISRRAYPDVDIAGLTVAAAKAIYRRDYWDACRCDELPAGVDLLVFDAAVNHGRGRAIKLLQKSLSVAADGKMGRITLTAAQRAHSQRLMSEYTGRRSNYYSDIVARRPKSRKYSLGWMRRAAAIHRRGMQLAGRVA